MNSNFTKSVMALAAIALEANGSALPNFGQVCKRERPIHSYIKDVLETNNDDTFLESYVTSASDG